MLVVSSKLRPILVTVVPSCKSKQESGTGRPNVLWHDGTSPVKLAAMKRRVPGKKNDMAKKNTAKPKAVTIRYVVERSTLNTEEDIEQAKNDIVEQVKHDIEKGMVGDECETIFRNWSKRHSRHYDERLLKHEKK